MAAVVFILKSTECQGNDAKNMQVRAFPSTREHSRQFMIYRRLWRSVDNHNLLALCWLPHVRCLCRTDRTELITIQTSSIQSRDTYWPCNFILKAWTHSRHLLRDVDQYTFPLSACRVDSLDQFQLNSLAKTASLLGHHHFYLIEDRGGQVKHVVFLQFQSVVSSEERSRNIDSCSWRKISSTATLLMLPCIYNFSLAPTSRMPLFI